MIDRIKCFFGRHDWFSCYFIGRHGGIFGAKCSRCGVWHKRSLWRGWR